MQRSLRIEPRHPCDSRPLSSEMQPYYSFGTLEKQPRDVKRKIDNRDG